MPSRHPPPWQLSPSLPPLPTQHILVLGEPPATELLPLLTSPHLANSLVLLATHAPPLLPAHALSAPGPAVRILRLRGPLAVHDAGALRLVSLLERAQRTAARWSALDAPDAPAAKPPSRSRSRTTPPARAPPPRIAQYAEDPKTGEFIVPEPVLCSASRRPHAVSGPPSSSAPPSAPASAPISASGSTASLPATMNIAPLAYPTPAHSREGSHTRLPLDDPSLAMPAISSRPASFHAGIGSAPFSPSSSFAGSLASTAGPGFTTGSAANASTAPPPSRARALARRASTVLSSSASSLLDGLFSSPLAGTAEEGWAYAVVSEAEIDRLVRPFDTLVNFLPAGGAPDKALLKHAVLVTTLGARFLEPLPGKQGKAAEKENARVEREKGKAEREREKEMGRIEKERERRASSALGMASTPASRRASWRFSVFSFASLASAHEHSVNEHGVERERESASHREESVDGHKDTMGGGQEKEKEKEQPRDVELHVPRTHIIHVLPATRHHHHVYGAAHEERKLARSIEQFLLAFSGVGASAGVPRPQHLAQSHPANEPEKELGSSSSATSIANMNANGNGNGNAPPSAYRRTTGTGPRRPPPSAYPAGRHRRLDGASVGGPSSSSGSGSGTANISPATSGEEIELEHRASTVLDNRASTVLDKRASVLDDSAGAGAGADKRASTYSAFSAFSAFWSSGNDFVTKESESAGSAVGKRGSVVIPEALIQQVPREQQQQEQVQVQVQGGHSHAHAHGYHHQKRANASTGPVPYLVAPGVFGAPVRGGGAVKVISSSSTSPSVSVPASASVSRSMSSASVSALSASLSFSSSALSSAVSASALALAQGAGAGSGAGAGAGVSAMPESGGGSGSAPVRPLSTGEALVLGALDVAALSAVSGAGAEYLSAARRAWVGPGDVAVRHESTGSRRAGVGGHANGVARARVGRNEEEEEGEGEGEEGGVLGRSSDEGERGAPAPGVGVGGRKKERYGERYTNAGVGAISPGSGSRGGSTEGEGEGSGNGESASESEWEGVLMRKGGAGEKVKALGKSAQPEHESVEKAEGDAVEKSQAEVKVEKEKEVKFEGLPTPPMSGAATPVEERASPVRELLADAPDQDQDQDQAQAQGQEQGSLEARDGARENDKADENQDEDKKALARRSLPPPPLPAKDNGAADVVHGKPNAPPDTDTGDKLIAGDLDELLQPLSLSLALSMSMSMEMPSSESSSSDSALASSSPSPPVPGPGPGPATSTSTSTSTMTPACSEMAPAPPTPMTPSTPSTPGPMTLDAHASDAHLPLALPYALGADRAMAASTPALVPSSPSSSASAAAAAALFGVDGGAVVSAGSSTEAKSAHMDKRRGAGEGKMKARARALQSAIRRFAVWRGKEKEKEKQAAVKVKEVKAL